MLGVLRRDDRAAVPSRHLGLVPAAERASAAAEAVAALGTLVAASCDLDAVLALARSASALTVAPWSPFDMIHDVEPAVPAISAVGRPVRIAVTGGPAFTFGYAEQAELLRAAGAEVVTVDPLRDENLPTGCDGLIIGGGFPEEHAPELAANAALRADVAALAGRGAPVSAECAGLLYLARSLDGHRMCGVLDVDTAMGPRLTLGYRRAVAACDSPIAEAGTPVTAHEFHRTSVLTTQHRTARSAWQIDGRPAGDERDERTEGFVHGGVHASYLHLHWAGVPGVAARFVAAARQARQARGPQWTA